MKRPAFTLIELILYIGITAMVVVALLRTMFTILETRNAVENVSVVQQELRFAMDHMTTTAMQASAVLTGSSFFDGEHGVLALLQTGSGGVATVYALSGAHIVVRTGSGPTLPLTSSRVIIEELRFANLTPHGTAGTVHVRMHARERGKGTTVDTLTLETAISLRH